jgi:glycosyltransferase involved in cell wall biosynthesis
VTTGLSGLRPRLGRARRRATRRLLRRPRVTVIIATYNWSTVLPYSIASVLDQTLDDFELWVIGDGCTDDSATVVSGIGDPRVRWHNLRSNTRNQAGPNNDGLRRARGEFVAYLGHDDLWLPQHLEFLTAAVDAGAPLAFGRQLRVDPGHSPYIWPPEQWHYQVGDWISPGAVVQRRESAERVGGWRFPVDCGDRDPEADLWARCTERFGPPVSISAVTSVKLTAGLRHGVYSERPCDEQSVWLARIRATPDANVFARDVPSEPDPATLRYPRADVPRELLAEVATTALERQRVARHFKGLE